MSVVKPGGGEPRSLLARHLRQAGLALALAAIGGCLESPFAAAPASGEPTVRVVAFDCADRCPSRVVDAAAACVITTPGKLSADRTSCRFTDGSRVVFAERLPQTAEAMMSKVIGLTLSRADVRCLDGRFAPLPRAAPPASTELVTALSLGSLDYRQTLRFDVSDAGIRPPSSVELRCGDRVLVGEGAGLCDSCADFGSCDRLPLVHLAVSIAGDATLRFDIAAANSRTALFTCRP